MEKETLLESPLSCQVYVRLCAQHRPIAIAITYVMRRGPAEPRPVLLFVRSS